jgi:hypothetical protein
VLIRDVFHHQGPFLGSGGHYSPGPTTDTPLVAMGRPLDGTLAPPWVFVRTSPIHVRVLRPEPRRTFRSPYPAMVSPTAVHFELDPRSLDPAALFGARMPSLFEVRRRLMTSATALRRAGNQTWALRPRRDDGLDHLPFLTHHAALSSSDARRAALRPPRRPRCWFLPVTRVFPTAMPPQAPHQRRFYPTVV